MADWLDRTRESITIIAPSGTEFSAKWAGDTMKLDNKYAVHVFPGIAGGEIQDLGMMPRVFDITIFFNDQENADLESKDFLDAFYQEIGDWSIIHPTKGPLTVVKISANEIDDPINSGGLYAVSTSWIEQLQESAELTPAQLQATAEAQSEQLNISAQEQFASNIPDNPTPGQKQSIITAAGKALTSIRTKLALVEGSLTLDSRIESIGLAIQNTLDGDIIDTSVLAAQIQRLVQIYGLGQVTATSGIQMYNDFANDILDDAPTSATKNDLSTIAVTEMVATAALTASGQMALIGGVESRQQTITTVGLLLDQFAVLTQRLDEIQTLFNAKPIDLAYFSQSNSYADSMLMAAKATEFLLLSVYGLPAERRVIIKEDTATLQVAKDQYGQINTEDNEIGNYQQLVDSNEFCCDFLWIIPAGTEVLIYQSN